MQTFKYTAVSRNGGKVTGIVEAFDEYAAVAKVKETCTVVTKIAPVKVIPREHKDLMAPKVSEKALAVMCSQFAIILGAGLPVVRAVELIAEQTADRALKKILQQAAGDVASGFSLAHSLESKGKVLPITFIETVRAGEESGTLDNSFARLHSYYDKSSKLKGKVQAAMIYPLFTLAVAVVVVGIIMVKAVPTFVSSFQSMGVDLPLPTRMLIAVSGFFVKYWAALLAAAAAFAILWKLWGQTEKGRLTQDRWKLKTPALGKLNRMKAAAQFANTLATMLAAGIPVMRAVSITAKVLDNACVGAEVELQVPRLEEGKTLTEGLRTCEFLPSLLVEMAGVGEETGTLETTLEVVGSFYDNETDLKSQKAISLLEPIIICVLAVIVVFILLAVYAPMFSLYGSY